MIMTLILSSYLIQGKVFYKIHFNHVAQIACLRACTLYSLFKIEQQSRNCFRPFISV
jgi:hypothetical protein